MIRILPTSYVGHFHITLLNIYRLTTTTNVSHFQCTLHEPSSQFAIITSAFVMIVCLVRITSLHSRIYNALLVADMFITTL